jgi:hypothetical protein
MDWRTAWHSALCMVKRLTPFLSKVSLLVLSCKASSTAPPTRTEIKAQFSLGDELKIQIQLIPCYKGRGDKEITTLINLSHFAWKHRAVLVPSKLFYLGLEEEVWGKPFFS